MKLHRNNLLNSWDRKYGVDITQVSLHVWAVPAWYRIIFPYDLRCFLRKLTSDEFQKKRSWRPRLTRVSAQRFEHLPRSDVNFKKGIGLVGACLKHGVAHEPVVCDFESSEFQNALAEGADAWEGQPSKVTWKLDFKQAKTLSEKYGQAMAVACMDESGEAIGCVTLELPRGAPIRLMESQKIQQELISTANTIATALSIAGNPAIIKE